MEGQTRGAWSNLRLILAQRNLSVLDLQRTLQKRGVSVNVKSLYRLAEPAPLWKIDARIVNAICQTFGLELGDLRERAGRRCEYCHGPEEVTGGRYQVDHILPKSIGGGDELGNLAFGCSSCNLAKSNHVSGLDPETQEQVALFNPRKDRWVEHFAFARMTFELRGKTAKGRATVAQLKMNITYQVEARKLWVELGLYP